MQTAAESSPPPGVQNEAEISVIQDDFSVPAGPEQKPVQVKNSTSSFNCLPLFNPMTVAEYREVVASWIGSILVLARHLQNQPNQNWASFHAEQLQQPEIRPEITNTHVELARYSALRIQSSIFYKLRPAFSLHRQTVTCLNIISLSLMVCLSAFAPRHACHPVFILVFFKANKT